jgi:hypothetical protein
MHNDTPFNVLTLSITINSATLSINNTRCSRLFILSAIYDDCHIFYCSAKCHSVEIRGTHVKI